MEKLIEKIKEDIKQAFIEYIELNIEQIDQEKLLDDMLNECLEDENTPYWFDKPADMLKRNDPIAYDQEKANYIDILIKDGDYIMINDELYKKDDIEGCQSDFESELNDEISNLVDYIDLDLL